jgi:ABC-type phosphate transport system permease subunit
MSTPIATPCTASACWRTASASPCRCCHVGRPGFLAWILATLLIKGFGALSPTCSPGHAGPGQRRGGLRNAIVGSLMMVGLSTAISTPIGILAGIYLAEYGEKTSSPR